MGNGWKALAVALGLAAALPAGAAAPHGSGGVLRLGIGVEGLGSRGYSCFYDAFGRLVCSDYSGISALLLAGDYDIPGRGILGPQSQLTVGLRLVAGGRHIYYTYANDTLTYLEPTGGLVWKFATASPVVEPRLEAGLGLYLGPQVGLALRGGGGLAFRLTPAVSLGLDLMIELGVLGGYGFSAVQFTVGPEFRI